METQAPVAATQAPRLGRSGSGRVSLVTAVTHDRISRFREFELACLAAASLTAPDLWRDARLLCWVLMPDHLHLMVALDDGAQLDHLVRSVKARISRNLNLAIGRRGRFWEAGFRDRGLQKRDDLIEIARYVVAHPIRAGLVRRVGDYPFWDAVWLRGAGRDGPRFAAEPASVSAAGVASPAP